MKDTKQQVEQIMHAAKSNQAMQIAVLLKEGASPNVRDITDRTALHYAALKGDTIIIGLLLHNKANPNVLDKQNKTPLHASVLSGNTTTISMLVAAGANTSAKDYKGRTPSDYAKNKNQLLLALSSTPENNITHAPEKLEEAPKETNGIKDPLLTKRTHTEVAAKKHHRCCIL